MCNITSKCNLGLSVKVVYNSQNNQIYYIYYTDTEAETMNNIFNDINLIDGKSILNNMPYFECVIGNPPYDGKLALQIWEKTNKPNICNHYINIMPDYYLINPQELDIKYGTKANIIKNCGDYLSKHIQDIIVLDQKKNSVYFNDINWKRGQLIILWTSNKIEKNWDLKIQKLSNLEDKIWGQCREYKSLRRMFIEKQENNAFVTVRRLPAPNQEYVDEIEIPIKAKEGIQFDSLQEAKNFRDSIRNTWLYKYLRTWEIGCDANKVPFLEDYKQPWTNERLFKLFNITDDEKQEIYNRIEKYPVSTVKG